MSIHNTSRKLWDLRRYNIRMLLVTALFLAVLIPAVVINLFTGVRGWQNGLTQATHQLQAITALREAQIDMWLEDVKRELALASTDRNILLLVRNILADPEDAGAGAQAMRLQTQLQQIRRQTGQFVALFLLDSQGKVLVSTDDTLIGATYDNVLDPQVELRDAYVAPFRRSSEAEMSILFLQPIFDGDTSIAILGGHTDLERLNTVMSSSIGLGETGETYLVDRNYTLLTESRFDGYVAGETIVQTVGTESAFEASKTEDFTAPTTYSDYRGVSVVGVYKRLSGLDVALVAEQNQTEIFGPTQDTLLLNGFVTFIAASLVTLVGVWLTETNIVRRLIKLSHTARAIAAGDLTLMAAVGREDEIGAVAQSFNDMTQQLRYTITDLERNEAKFRNIIESAPIGMHLYRLDKDEQLVFVDANPAAEYMLAIDSNQCVGKTVAETFPALGEQASAQFWDTAATGKPWQGEHTTSDDSQVQKSYEIYAFHTSPREMVVAFQDVTERKRAEEVLRENEERLRQVVQNMPVMMNALDEDGNFVVWNHESERVTGYGAKEMINNPRAPELLFPDPVYRERMQAELVAMGGDYRDWEWKTTCKNGSIRTIAWSDISGRFPIPGWAQWGIGVDITERKQAEDALRERQYFIESVVNTMPDIVYIYDLVEHRNVYANHEILSVLGYSPEEIRQMGDQVFELTLHPDDAETVAEHHKRMASVKDEILGLEYRMKDAKDQWRWLHSRDRVFLKNEDNTTRQIIGIASDVTDRRRAEEMLRENEMILQSAIEGAPIILFKLDTNGIFQLSSGAGLKGLGLKPGEVVGLSHFELFEDLPEANEHVLRALKGEAVHFETEMRGIVWDVRYSPLFGPQNEVTGMVGVVNDITERKRAEDELRESEAKFRALYTSMSEGLALHEVLYDVDGKAIDYRILDVNPSYEDLTGLERVQAVGKKASELYGTGEPPYIDVYARVAASGPPISFEAVFPPMQKNFSISVFSPTPGQFVTVFSDITKRKQAEEEREFLLAQIREQAQRVQQIIDTVPEGVLVLNTERRIVIANPVAEEVLSTLTDVGVTDILTRLGDRDLGELLTSPPRGLWHEVTVNGAVPRSFEVIARPIETGPTQGGWVLVIRDVTHEREIQRHVQQQERLAAVGQLAAGIAHDFNNIMAVIALYAQIVQRIADLPPKAQERLATISQQAHRATDLVEQILDFSRRSVIERQPLDLVPFLKEQVKLLERTLPENIKIISAYATDECSVNADPTRIQQSITNLAVNARDAMPEGGELTIRIEQAWLDAPLFPEMEPGAWVKISVSDTGAGIPADALPHIFEPFFTTKAPEGTGLGLAQVYGIVKQHEGYIDVVTQEGEGTTFVLYLPALLASPVDAPTLEARVLIQGHGEIVLVAEDDSVTREALVDSLELLGYQVLTAENGREALAVWQQHRDEIAVVLSDVVMPEMGGVALFHALREQDESIKIVLLTGHALEQQLGNQLGDLKNQGLIDWLRKPISLEQLAQVIDRILTSRQ